MPNWRIEIKPAAEKSYLKLDRTMRRRIKTALLELEAAPDPLHHPKVRALTGNLEGDYRLRIGQFRVLFTPDPEALVIHVFAILTRGKAY